MFWSYMCDGMFFLFDNRLYIALKSSEILSLQEIVYVK